MNKYFEDKLDSYGYTVNYCKWGTEGPKIVILHSMGMDCHSMDLLCESLKDKYQLLSLTILDHGDSDSPKRPIQVDEHAEIMRSCYLKLGFSPNILIGHSIGGRMGMILSAEYPKEIKGLILVDIATSALGPSYATPQQRKEVFKNQDEMRNWIRNRYPMMDDYYLENRYKHGFVAVEGGFTKKPIGDVIRGAKWVDLWPYVNRITCPTLLILGEKSTLVSPETQEMLKKTVTKLKIVTVKGASHMVPQDKPEDFEEHVKRFLEGLEF